MTNKRKGLTHDDLAKHYKRMRADRAQMDAVKALADAMAALCGKADP